MLRHFLPLSVNNELFGFRKKFGQKADEDDDDWKKWLSVYPSAYRDTQKTSKFAKIINNAGYTILSDINLKGCNVAEIGPGGGYHFNYFKGKPAKYDVFDVCDDFFPELEQKANEIDLPITSHKIAAYKPNINLPDNSLDYIFGFYVIEHLHPLEQWMKEIFRVLKPNGQLIGAIPTEGSILWGLGRCVTSRKILKKQYGLDIRKIVCWEHPNMVDTILKTYGDFGNVQHKSWPINLLPLDCNLVVQFKVTKTRLND